MVWPETKVNVSESYLPPVVQVLSYLMEEINGLAPVPESSETTQSASSSSATSEATESVSSSAATSEATEMASSSATTSEQTETTVETTSESSVTTEDLAESSDALHNSSSTTEALSFSSTPNYNDSTPATDLSESANHTVIEEDLQVNIYLTLLYHCQRFLICYRLVLNIILIILITVGALSSIIV